MTAQLPWAEWSRKQEACYYYLSPPQRLLHSGLVAGSMNHRINIIDTRGTLLHYQ